MTYPAPSAKSHFLIAAPASHSGKTTLTLGLLRALSRRGLAVQPFKCGPDYIDPLHHRQAAGTPSVNLDTFMASESHVAELYARYADRADVAVTEGCMGLFDGSDRMQGSSAAIAQLLSIPVILVINARAMAYSAAPLLYGFKNFCKGVNVAGAIFNLVSTESHYRFLQEACEDAGVEALGYLPPNEGFAIPSRHLGLHLSSETDYEAVIERVADAIPKTIDLDRLLALTRREGPGQPVSSAAPVLPADPIRISVARDEAFVFTYPQNLAALEQLGPVTYFSPLRDAVLPPTDLLYLPGGYPELVAEALSQNAAMRQSVADYCRRGGLTYAECGGLMYLGQHLRDAEGRTFPMTGVLDLGTTLQPPRMTLGYRVVNWDGLQVKGHEFHYSQLDFSGADTVPATVRNARGLVVETPLFRVNNTFAAYTHLYWADNPAFLRHLLAQSTRPTLTPHE